ncbi:MAG: dihydroneopterin aldolase [Flavobacteriaceae bacterium]
MDKITLRTIRVYAHHGCLEEETIIGSDYQVNLIVWAQLENACKTDALKDTIDYVHLNKIVRKEMHVPTKLLEHVAHRIVDSIFLELEMAQKVQVEVAKINPPIGGDVASVSVTLERTRN